MSFAKTAAASSALFGFGWLARQALGTIFPLETFWQVALQSFVTLVVGLGAFAIVATLLKSEEFREFREGAERRLFKKTPILSGAEEAQL